MVAPAGLIEMVLFTRRSVLIVVSNPNQYFQLRRVYGVQPTRVLIETLLWLKLHLTWRALVPGYRPPLTAYHATQRAVYPSRFSSPIQFGMQKVMNGILEMV